MQSPCAAPSSVPLKVEHEAHALHRQHSWRRRVLMASHRVLPGRTPLSSSSVVAPGQDWSLSQQPGRHAGLCFFPLLEAFRSTTQKSLSPLRVRARAEYPTLFLVCPASPRSTGRVGLGQSRGSSPGQIPFGAPSESVAFPYVLVWVRACCGSV